MACSLNGRLGTLPFEDRDGSTIVRPTIACASQADRDALLEMRVDAGTLQTLENLGTYVARLSATPAGPPRVDHY